MTYRPHPSADRARRQLNRHPRHEPAVPLRVGPTAARFARALAVAFPPNYEQALRNLRALSEVMPGRVASARRESA